MSSDNNALNKTGRMELLAPAGNIEKLETALTYGADSVYMGLEDFSLRANAGNIGYDQYDRLREIKSRFPSCTLYCTVNIFFHNRDIDKLKERIELIRPFPFDSFIVSDLGALPILQKDFPGARFSLSTQANCLNAQSAKLYGKMGFDTIILGRETSLTEIRQIKDANPDLRIEAFVHGAMCMAYSGRCMLSSHLTGRSANQGDCAHTCRWNYRLALEEEQRPGVYFPISEENGYTTILSSKDMCMIDHLADLKNAGVDSLKIEGRMKSTYYVATVTRAYRKAIDALYDPSVDFKPFRDELFNVSHRPYSTGFFYSDGPVDTEDDINIASAPGYMRDYLFLGTVLDEVKPGIWSVDIKNQIKPGTAVEFIGPDVLSVTDSNLKVLDQDFNETEHIDHCRTGYLKSSIELKKGWIIRQEVKKS